MHFNLTPRIVLYFSILAIYSAVNYIFLVNSEKEVVIQQAWIEHTHKVIIDSQELLSHMRDAETGQRGFLLTLNTSYLEPYEIGVRDAAEHLANLKKLTRDNAQQQIRLTDVTELVDEKILELRQTISLAEKGVLSEAMAIVNSDAGKIIMDNIRKVIGEILSEEEQLLKSRTKLYQEKRNNLILLMTVELVVFMMLIIVIGYFVYRRVARPLSVMKKTIDEQGDMNEIHKIADNYHDEVGKLANAFIKLNLEIEVRNKNLHDRVNDNIKLRQRADEQATRAKKDEVYVSSVLNTVRDGVVTINSKGLVEVFNPGAENIFGYKKHEVMGKNISMLMPEPHQHAHDGYI